MTKATKDRFWTAARDNPSLAEVRSWKEQAIQLAREPAVNFYDLADILLNLRECDSALLNDVADQANISRRKVYYLLAAGQLIADWAITRAEAESVGWTKLATIEPVPDTPMMHAVSLDSSEVIAPVNAIGRWTERIRSCAHQ